MDSKTEPRGCVSYFHRPGHPFRIPTHSDKFTCHNTHCQFNKPVNTIGAAIQRSPTEPTKLKLQPILPFSSQLIVCKISFFGNSTFTGPQLNSSLATNNSIENHYPFNSLCRQNSLCKAIFYYNYMIDHLSVCTGCGFNCDTKASK